LVNFFSKRSLSFCSYFTSSSNPCFFPFISLFLSISFVSFYVVILSSSYTTFELLTTSFVFSFIFLRIYSFSSKSFSTSSSFASISAMRNFYCWIIYSLEERVSLSFWSLLEKYLFLRFLQEVASNRWPAIFPVVSCSRQFCLIACWLHCWDCLFMNGLQQKFRYPEMMVRSPSLRGLDGPFLGNFPILIFLISPSFLVRLFVLKTLLVLCPVPCLGFLVILHVF